MGIFQKLSMLFRSNVSDLINRAEDPEKMLTQILEDLRVQLARAKEVVAVAIADERKLRDQAENERRQALDWENRAMLAVREERDDLARQALVRHQEYAERAAMLEATWRRQAEETTKLKDSLRQLNERIEEARRKRSLLIAKHKRAQAHRRIQETITGLSDPSAFEAFDRMAEKIEDAERRNIATAEVTESLGGDGLEKEFAELEGAASVDDRLLALKERMGLAPANDEARRLRPAHVEEIKDAVLEEDD